MPTPGISQRYRSLKFHGRISSIRRAGLAAAMASSVEVSKEKGSTLFRLACLDQRADARLGAANLVVPGEERVRRKSVPRAVF